MRSAQTLWSGFATTDGLLGYSLKASLGGSTLSTLTVWRDHDAMTAFVRGEPHVSIVHQTSRWLADARFASWTVTGADLPPTWQAATEQLDQTNRAVRT